MLRQCGWLAGWLAGCLSVTRRYYINTAKPILKLFRPSGSPIILASSEPCADTQFQGEPLRVKYTGVGKIGDFFTEIAVYLANGTRQADDYYGTLIGSPGCRIEWYNF